MSEMYVKIVKLNKDAVIPSYAHYSDSGFDFTTYEDIDIPPNTTLVVPTGLAFAVPQGYEMQIRLRSSIGLRTPLIIPNAPGTVDAGYRGEVGIIVRNLASHSYFIPKGTRLAQGVIAPVQRCILRLVDKLPESDRGTGGYGSTGGTV